MPRVKRSDGWSFVARDAAAGAEIIAEQVAALEAELAVEQTFHEACKVFLGALVVYAATFPHGLDPCDPDSELMRDVDCSIEVHEAAVRGLLSRIKDARVQLKRAGERRFA